VPQQQEHTHTPQPSPHPALAPAPAAAPAVAPTAALTPAPARAPPDVLKPDIQCVRTHWIRGFMAFQLARRTRIVVLMGSV